MKNILLLAALLLPSTCFALGETDSMMCNNGIASPGDSINNLIQKCGQPVAKRGSGRTYKVGRNTYYGEEWVYDHGPSQFIYIAIVAGGQVKLFYSTRDIGTAKR